MAASFLNDNENFRFEGKAYTDPLLEQLLSQPELWDKNPSRLSNHGPHRGTHDIFLRGEDETDFINGVRHWKDHGKVHAPVWYQSIDKLPWAKTIITKMALSLIPEMLGGCYIYKVKPGEKVLPHIDKGWHPEYFSKFNICLQTNDKAAFVYPDEELKQKVGDVHRFRNDRLHSVINEGDTDHIVMIVCMRFDDGYRCPWSPEGWSIDKQLGI